MPPLPIRMEFNFASYAETSAFLKAFQEHLAQSGAAGSVLLQGSDNAWKLYNDFKECARPGDAVRFACRADPAFTFTPMPEADIIANAHIVAMKYADVFSRIDALRGIYKNPDTHPLTARRNAIDETFGIIEDLVEKGIIAAKKFAPHYGKKGSGLIYLDKYNYIEAHYRKLGYAFNEDGKHNVELRLREDISSEGIQTFLRQFNPVN